MKTNEEKLKAASDESRTMLFLATRQLVEHKEYLKKSYREQKSRPVSVEYWENMVDCIRLQVVAKEPRIRDQDGRPTISVVYEYPDELHDFLTSDSCPAALKESLVGGLDVEKKVV